MNEGILVTGLGIISGIGLDVESTLNSLKQEQSGIGDIRYLSTSLKEYPVSEVRMDDRELLDFLGISQDIVITRTSLLGISAVREAIKSAELSIGSYSRIGLISGTTVGGMEKSEQFYSDFLSNNSRNNYISAHDCGACTEAIADNTGRYSYVSTISTACSSAANSIIFGAQMIRQGLLDCVVAGGTECLTKFHLNGFKTLMILDPKPCRPFDESRAGLNLGEGAAFLVLESEEHARKRNAKALCRLSGYANSCDAYHQTASSPDGKGAILAMQNALRDASLLPGDIDYINAHGTGTTNNDESEGNAIAAVFGSHIPPVSSTKPFTGHTTSAAGGVEAVISILALLNGFIPANLNLSNPMPELKFTPPFHNIYDIKLKHVLSNSFGFGGNNSSLIFSQL